MKLSRSTFRLTQHYLPFLPPRVKSKGSDTIKPDEVVYKTNKENFTSSLPAMQSSGEGEEEEEDALIGKAPGDPWLYQQNYLKTKHF